MACQCEAQHAEAADEKLIAHLSRHSRPAWKRNDFRIVQKDSHAFFGTRPEEIIEEIAALDAESAEILGTIRALL